MSSYYFKQNLLYYGPDKDGLYEESYSQFFKEYEITGGTFNRIGENGVMNVKYEFTDYCLAEGDSATDFLPGTTWHLKISSIEIEAKGTYKDSNPTYRLLLVNNNYLHGNNISQSQKYYRQIDSDFIFDENTNEVNFIFTIPSYEDIKFNNLVLIIKRSSEDYTNENEDGTKGRKINAVEYSLEKMINLIESEGDVQHLGIQAPTGTYFSLGGDTMMIGRRGLYENPEDISLTQCFIYPPSNTQTNGYLGMNILLDMKCRSTTT